MLFGFLLMTSLLATAANAVTTVRVLTYNVYAKPDFTEGRLTQERMDVVCDRLGLFSQEIERAASDSAVLLF